MEYIKYVTDLGFAGVQHKPLKKAPPHEVRGFTFTSFDPEVTRRNLGKPRAHKLNLFVFVLAKTRGVRVDTKNNVVLLGNSLRAVTAFLESVNEDT